MPRRDTVSTPQLCGKASKATQPLQIVQLDRSGDVGGRTATALLGVKGSQVQILSSRRSEEARSIWVKAQVSGLFRALVSILSRLSTMVRTGR